MSSDSNLDSPDFGRKKKAVYAGGLDGGELPLFIPRPKVLASVPFLGDVCVGSVASNPQTPYIVCSTQREDAAIVGIGSAMERKFKAYVENPNEAPHPLGLEPSPDAVSDSNGNAPPTRVLSQIPRIQPDSYR